MRLAAALCLMFWVWPTTARAEWLEASSAHFVVYADDSERDIRRFSDRLERYHAAMAFLTGTKLPPPSPSNRVTVYVVGSPRAVRSLAGDGDRYLGGFYIPRAGGSLAIVPKVKSVGREPSFSMIVLLHEYAHHFVTSTSSFPLPRWLSEGGAEFFASASFGSGGTVDIGKPAQHRATELLMPQFARDVTAAELIDPSAYEKPKGRGYDAFYGKSWLLYHFLVFDEARQGQLTTYIRLMTEGKSSRDAGVAAFGDLAKLDDDLQRYLNSRRMKMLSLSAELLSTEPVAVRRLRAGEAAMMPIRIRSRRGVDEEQAKALLVDARAIAARYPRDPAVLAALAEAEHDAGNDADSVAAADAALARDPAQVNAYIQKGLSLLRMAADAKPADEHDVYRQARDAFLALNLLENDHPLPLIYNYRIVVEQGIVPSEQTLRGLARAAELAPFDLGLRMTLAMRQLRDGERDEARRNLAPVAFNPHGGGLAEMAQKVLAAMDGDPNWDGSGIIDQPVLDGLDGEGDEGRSRESRELRR